MATEANMDAAINQAISRVREQSLCPRRIWAIALNLPGRESNIPALVPDKRLHMECSSAHSFCSTGPSHQNCTFDFCEISAVNFTNVVQLHRSGCDQNCKKKDFPIHLLDKPAEESRPTAWAIDGKLRPLEPGEPYMAISHVWSDGTGGNGSVNECLYAFFCDVARDLKCKGLWWDAICIPQDKRARAKAINRMHEYYSQATSTIVHDLCLATSEWAGPDHASFLLVMSNWFTRGWTALELARSKQVEVLFNAPMSPGYLRKNLDDDILSHPGTVSSSSRSVASAAIRALRGVNEKQLKRQLTVNDILTSLGPRFTSWARDRATITGLFVGMESLPNDQHEIYQQVIRKIGRITAGQLFHNSAALDNAFAWFPSNLFDLPVASESSETLQVTEDGEIVGQWRLMHTLSGEFDPGLSLDSFFFWDMVHPLTECYVRDALKSFDHHIILGERNVDTHTRGLLVKVMRSKHRGEILCSYVGPVYFRKVDLEPLATITVRIANGGLDLGKGANAIEYIRREHRPDHPVPEGPMFSIGPTGMQPMPSWWDRGEEDTSGSRPPITDVGPGAGVHNPNDNMTAGPGKLSTNTAGPSTNQPQAHLPMTAEWQYGLWDFADAPTTFFQACCCPSYTYARNLNDFEGGNSSCICCGANWWTHFCLTWFCCNASCLIRSPLRTKIRRKSRIKESYLDTIGSICWPCGLSQETREMEFHKSLTFG